MYCIKSIKKEDLVEYLLNPFERAFAIDQFIYQKYGIENLEDKDEPLDRLYILNNDNSSYAMAAVIDYSFKQIFIKEAYYFDTQTDDGDCYKRLHRLKWKISDTLDNYMDKANILKKKEIEEHPRFIELYEKNKKEYFQEIVNALLNISSYVPLIADTVPNRIADYIEFLTLEELRSAYHKKFEKMYKFADELLFSDESLNVLSFKKVNQDAVAYVQSGKLSKNDQRSKECYDAICKCNAKRFTVIDIDGNRVSCSSYVNLNAMLHSTGSTQYSVYLHDIEQIIYKGKKIYKATA